MAGGTWIPITALFLVSYGEWWRLKQAVGKYIRWPGSTRVVLFGHGGLQECGHPCYVSKRIEFDNGNTVEVAEIVRYVGCRTQTHQPSKRGI